MTLPVVVIDKVTKAWSVNDGQTKTNTVLFNVWRREKLSTDAANRVIGNSVPALMLSMATVWGRSALGGRGSLGGYRRVLKRVLMRVDLPRPDSPDTVNEYVKKLKGRHMALTDDHGVEVEALAHALPVDLVGEIRETDVAHELLTDDGGGGAVGSLLGEGGGRAVHVAVAVRGHRVAVGGGNVRVRHLEEVSVERRRKRGTADTHFYVWREGKRWEDGGSLRVGESWRLRLGLFAAACHRQTQPGFGQQ